MLSRSLTLNGDNVPIQRTNDLSYFFITLISLDLDGVWTYGRKEPVSHVLNKLFAFQKFRVPKNP